MAVMTIADSVGQGTVSFTQTGSRTDGDARNNRSYATYEFTAVPAAGWSFARWESRSRSQSYSSNYGPGAWSTWSNWSTFSTSDTASQEFPIASAYDSGGVWGSGGTNYEHEVRAVFTAQSYSVAVRVSSESPANSGTVSGGGIFNAGASCTVSATANAGYEFTKWTLADGAAAAAVSMSASYTFTVTASVTLYAHFKRAATGKLLYGSGGRLLHGSAGTLLYDGD